MPRSYLPPSFSNGFARCASQARYPQLWTGIVGAWNPSLGRTAGKLYDFGERHNDGTLTNMENADDWITSEGRLALSFGGTDEFITLPTIDRTTMSISAWINWQSTTGRQQIFSNGNSAGSALNYWFEINRATSTEKISFLRSSSAVSVAGTITITTGVWTHVAVTVSGGTGAWLCTLYVNGKYDNSATDTNNPNSTGELTSIGRAGAFDGNYFIGYMTDIRLYDVAISADNVALLARRPSIAFEKVPRRVRKAQVAATRRYGVIGGGVHYSGV